MFYQYKYNTENALAVSPSFLIKFPKIHKILASVFLVVYTLFRKVIKMLYQKLLMGDRPYFVAIGSTPAFEAHQHPEIEISYCIDGTYDILCEKGRYSLTAGDFAVVGPMAVHEFPETGGVCKRLTVELGYAFLGDYYEAFPLGCCIFRKNDAEALQTLLAETAVLRDSDAPFSDLAVQGNLYKISALLLEILQGVAGSQLPSRKMADIRKIDKALELIYTSYYTPLTVEQVSASCGYSKSNFCKIFKSITGDTFHNTLNRHRVEIACDLLRSGGLTVEAVAAKTGFTDSKSFCRAFKQITGKTAKEYRKRDDL